MTPPIETGGWSIKPRGLVHEALARPQVASNRAAPPVVTAATFKPFGLDLESRRFQSAAVVRARLGFNTRRGDGCRGAHSFNAAPARFHGVTIRRRAGAVLA
ncbi:MAG: hypothetical protein HY898_28645 [Deltaproteobacteria bacterium]|nr:hypothetical protein [Deltaproteobacteria bacterium]